MQHAGPDPTHRHGVGPRTWAHYLLAGAVVVCCFLFVPGLDGNAWLIDLIAVSATAAIVTGVVRYRPHPRLPWVLFILAQLTFLLGDVLYYTDSVRFGSVAGGLYMAYYPAQVAGLLLLIRSRVSGRDLAGLLDALIVALAVGLPAWVFLIDPFVHDPHAGSFDSILLMSYPALDVLLLAVAAWLVMGSGSRSPAFNLLVASTAALIVTDTVYGAAELTGSYQAGSWLDAGWMISYVLWGAAALHPSMRDLAARTPERSESLTARRILLLASAVLIGPALLAVDYESHLSGFDPDVVLAASVAIFALALVRVLGLVASLRTAIARHERAEQRETILRHAATALTASPDREYVRLATIEGAVALARDLPDAEVTVDLSNGGARRHAEPHAQAAGTVVVSLSTRGSPHGRLVLTSSAPVPTDVADGLHTLGAQAALALEAVALTEGLSARRSEARVGALVQNSSDMIMVVDADLVIEYVTPSVAQSLGHLPVDLIGLPATSLAEPDDQAAVRDFYQRIARHPGKSVTAEWRMRRADGRFTEFEAVVCNLLANPSVQGIVVTAHDITDRKALEVGLKRQVKELEELDRLRNDFVATVSHELRTPLTNIMGEVELLEDGDRGELSECQGLGVNAIDRNSRRLLTLIEDLLTLGQVETSALRLRREPTVVARLMDDVGSQVAPAAAAKSVTVELDYGADVGVIVADPVQLDRALLNLLNNAVKFTPSGGRAALRVGRVGDDVEFTVSDTGVGIPQEEQVRLFTRFFRSSVATRLAIQGTGLGLVIVKRIVEAHGGTVSIVSKVDVGTTVTVRMPAGVEEAAEEEGAA